MSLEDILPEDGAPRDLGAPPTPLARGRPARIVRRPAAGRRRL